MLLGSCIVAAAHSTARLAILSHRGIFDGIWQVLEFIWPTHGRQRQTSAHFCKASSLQRLPCRCRVMWQLPSWPVVRPARALACRSSGWVEGLDTRAPSCCLQRLGMGKADLPQACAANPKPKRRVPWGSGMAEAKQICPPNTAKIISPQIPGWAVAKFGSGRFQSTPGGAATTCLPATRSFTSRIGRTQAHGTAIVRTTSRISGSMPCASRKAKGLSRPCAQLTRVLQIFT